MHKRVRKLKTHRILLFPEKYWGHDVTSVSRRRTLTAWDRAIHKRQRGARERSVKGGAEMPNDETRLRLAQWILERNLSWIAAAEVKTAVIVGINTGMLGAVVASFSAAAPSSRTAWAYLFTIVSVLCLGLGVFCASMSVLPRLTGPRSSFIFFGRIAQSSEADYAGSFRNAADSQLLDDCLAQIHRNAEIARDKFGWVRSGMAWSFAGVMPWVAALACLKL